MRAGDRAGPSRRLPAFLVVVAALAALCACSKGGQHPVEIVLNEDACSLCRMAVSQRQFAAELVTGRGRVEVFDDIGCLTRWLSTHPPRDGAAAFVVDYETGAWLAAERASYVKSPALPTPMGYGLAAFGDRGRAEAATRELGGTVVAWDQLTQRGPA